MQLSQLHDVVKEHQRQATQDGIEQPKVEITATYCKSVDGFIVSATVNRFFIVVGSARLPRRVFKTLDALRRALNEAGFNSFTVNG